MSKECATFNIYITHYKSQVYFHLNQAKFPTFLSQEDIFASTNVLEMKKRKKRHMKLLYKDEGSNQQPPSQYIYADRQRDRPSLQNEGWYMPLFKTKPSTSY
jgi:hypothetical protein